MIHSALVGLPGLLALAAGFVPFLAGLLVARARNRGGGAGGTRSGRSIAGIAIQTFGIFLIAVGRVRLELAADAPEAIVAAVVVALLMAATAGLFIAATRALGRNWSLVARMRGDHQLVETGPFAQLRHPIYTALALFALAIAVAFGHLSHLWFAAPFFVLGTWLRVVEEERLLRATFGPVYDGYAARVKRFVPGLF